MTALTLVTGPGAVAHAQPRAVLVFHPGGKEERPRTVFKRLAARPALSLGLLGATQGPYSVRQTLLDFTQGHRISRSGYDPRNLPRMRLLQDAPGWRIRGWRTAVRRAASAPALIRPGLLAAAIPGGAGYVGVGRTRPHVEAIVAADAAGRVAEVSLGLSSSVGERTRATLTRRRLVVVALSLGAQADRALDELIAARRPEDLLLVVRAPPRSRAAQLLPAGAAGLGGDVAPGLLRSRTTRRDGLVAGHDVLPTLLEHLRLPVPSGVRGRPMFVTAARGRDVAYLRRLERRLRVVYPRRYPALRAVVLALAIVALLGYATGRRRAAWRTAGLALLWLPAMALVTAALAPSRTLELVLVSAGTVVMAVLTDRLLPWPRAPAVPAIGGVAAYCVDLAFGSPLIVRSLLGPNPRFGARWFGIGNELEAALPVMLLVGLAAAAGAAARSRRLAAGVGGAMLLLGGIVGAGRLGADVGGVITIGAGAAAAVLLCLPGRLTRRRVVLACAAPIAAVLALAAIDLVTGGDAHFTATVLGAEDSGALGDVVRRRTALAVDALLRGLMPLATAAAIALVVVAYRRRRSLYAPVQDRPAWRAALAGGLAAGGLGSIANDSGPVLLVIAVVVLAAATAYVRGAPVACNPARTPD